MTISYYVIFFWENSEKSGDKVDQNKVALQLHSSLVDYLEHCNQNDDYCTHSEVSVQITTVLVVINKTCLTY